MTATISSISFYLSILISLLVLFDFVDSRGYRGRYSGYRGYYSYRYSSGGGGNGWIAGVVIGSIIVGMGLIIGIYCLFRWCVVNHKKPSFQVKPQSDSRTRCTQNTNNRNQLTTRVTTIPSQNSRSVHNIQGNTTTYPPQYSPASHPGIYDPRVTYPPPPPVYTVNDEIGQIDNRISGTMSPPPSYSDAVNTRPS